MMLSLMSNTGIQNAKLNSLDNDNDIDVIPRRSSERPKSQHNDVLDECNSELVIDERRKSDRRHSTPRPLSVDEIVKLRNRGKTIPHAVTPTRN